MEDLWKDITLSTLTSLRNTSNSTPAGDVARRRNFQDFLVRRPSLQERNSSVSAGSSNSASSPALQTTRLSLTTDSSSGQSPHNYCPFDHSFSSAINWAQDGVSDEVSLSDRRHKRMIKNRESAARSRARKHAYTTELELEVAHLKQENARLKMEMHNQAAPDQTPKKPKISRSSSSPF